MRRSMLGVLLLVALAGCDGTVAPLAGGSGEDSEGSGGGGWTGGGEGMGGGAGGGGGGGACVPITCAKGRDCGSISDGRRKTLNCGTCTVAGQSCGGSGIPNVCGVTGQCANQPPANAMSVQAGVTKTFTAAGHTNWVAVPQGYDTGATACRRSSSCGSTAAAARARGTSRW